MNEQRTVLEIDIAGIPMTFSATDKGWEVMVGGKCEEGRSLLSQRHPSLLDAIDSALESSLRISPTGQTTYEYLQRVDKARQQRKALRMKYDYRHLGRGGRDKR